MAKNSSISKLKNLAKQYGIEDNALFLTTLDRYIAQQRIIDMIKEELDNVDVAVSKEYVKGRENIYAHPLVKELPKHSDAANKTASLLLEIINKLGEKPKSADDEFEAFLNEQ